MPKSSLLHSINAPIWNAYAVYNKDYAKECDYEELLELVNSEDFFRPFSERLLEFYNKQAGTNFDIGSNDAANDLYKRMTGHGIDISRNTLKSWFKDKVPKYGDDGRDSIFKIAFALELLPSETESLFNKVFLDKAFNIRNPRELTYLYCLQNGKSFTEAQQLLGKISDNDDGEAAETKYIGNVAVNSARVS